MPVLLFSAGKTRATMGYSANLAIYLRLKNIVRSALIRVRLRFRFRARTESHSYSRVIARRVTAAPSTRVSDIKG